jgi:hypothetical protein
MYKLGHLYEVDDTVILVDYYPGVCDGCYFQEKCAYGEMEDVPACEAADRKDFTDVIFLEV